VSSDDEETANTAVGMPPVAEDPSEPEGSPDALFRSFVANAYEDVPPLVAPIAGPLPIREPSPTRRPLPSVNASLRKHDGWIHGAWADSMEELLEVSEAPDELAAAHRDASRSPRPAPIASLVDDLAEERLDTEPPPPERPTPAEPVSRALVSATMARAAERASRTEAEREEGTLRVVLLTRKKGSGELRTEAPRPDPGEPVNLHEEPTRVLGVVESPAWQSVVRPPSSVTQRREALALVPDVAHVELPPPPPAEGSEDGLIPGGELDRKLSDMAVLLRYGHESQVRGELDQLTAEYPRDLLLLRRISEFWVGHQKHGHACDALFGLASGLFERRNVEGMRQALEQVLVLSPGNERAERLLSLLAERPGDA
jgi:hypothetical protein